MPRAIFGDTDSLFDAYAITEYNEQLVRRLIEKVTVYEDKFTVEFKSGVTVDVGE